MGRGLTDRQPRRARCCAPVSAAKALSLMTIDVTRGQKLTLDGRVSSAVISL